MYIIQPVSSAQQFFVLSLTDAFPEIWTDPNLLSISMTRSSTLIPYKIYLWDTQLLAQKVGDIESSGNSNRTIFNYNYYTVDKNSSNWSQIWIDNIDDDSGSHIYDKMETGFTVSLFNRYAPINFKYTGSFSFNPMVPFNTVGDYNQLTDGSNNTVVDGSTPPGDTTYLLSETYSGEYTLWTAIVFPGIPLIISSTIPNNQQFGPIFASNASLSVSGQGKLSPVQIRMAFAGSRSFRGPVMDFLDPVTVPTADYLPNTNIPTITQGLNGRDDGSDYFQNQLSQAIDGTMDSIKYRTASLMDCALSTDLLTSIAEIQGYQETLTQNYLDSLSQDLRLVGMKLSMEQEVKFTAPGPIATLTEQNGPRFASISNRIVRGSITYLSNQNNIDGYDRSSSLTMYFGGPFLFPMQNVEWQRPKQAIRAGDNYVHEIEFIARACDNIVSLPGTDAPSSEFAISLSPLLENLDG